jgi:hypothetical protein
VSLIAATSALDFMGAEESQFAKELLELVLELWLNPSELVTSFLTCFLATVNSLLNSYKSITFISYIIR